MFKIGDIVECIADSGTHPTSYKKGQLYKVIHVTNHWIRTTSIDGSTNNGWASKFFKLSNRISHLPSWF